MGFLPITKKEIDGQLDFVFVTGDAYVDHPSFGAAIVSRVLEAEGYKVGIIAQPNWRDCEEFKRLGKPKLGFLVNSGNIDSMVNHYTAAKKPRSTDAYSPGGKAGCRPDRAVIVYCNRIREAYGDIPVIIGGIEASLRRFAHYDFWDNKVRRSVLLDSRADLLVYGMGEKPILDIAQRLKTDKVKTIKDVSGTCYVTSIAEGKPLLPSFEEVRDNKIKYAQATAMMFGYDKNFGSGEQAAQLHYDKYVVQNLPAPPLMGKEMDRVYALPYMRTYHPSYEAQGGVPAIEEVKFSITANRGCFGGCNFCALHFHQGKAISTRSEKSILAEAERMAKDPEFKGYIHDVGGPTANFRNMPCSKKEPCKNRNCMFPTPCKNLKIDHKEYLALLRKLRQIHGVKKVFIRSGIRYDYLINDKDDSFFRELCEHHVSGQLKVAPEHISDRVLEMMGKPSKDVYNRFSEKFYHINQKLNKKQFLVPYLMSSHPGSTLNDAILLAEYLRDKKINPEQVQDFYPTPGSISTCMYYTEIDPRTMKRVYVPKEFKEKAMQRALLQYRRPQNYNLVYEALTKAEREDLIGYGNRCLIKPKEEKQNGKNIRWKSSEPKNKGRVKGTSSKPKRKRR